MELRELSDQELADYRASLNQDKLRIKALERATEEEFQVREALKGVPDNVKRIILEGRVEASGVANA